MSAARPLVGLAGAARRASRCSNAALPAGPSSATWAAGRRQQPTWPLSSSPFSSTVASYSTLPLAEPELSRAVRRFTSVPTAAESRTLSLESADPAVSERRAQLLEEIERMDEKRGEQVRLSCACPYSGSTLPDLFGGH
jgi:hypothetical protein